MFYYHLISEKVVAMVVNGSERFGGDYPSPSPSEGGEQKRTIIPTVLVLASTAS